MTAGSHMPRLKGRVLCNRNENQRPQTKEFGLCIKLLSLEHDFEIKIHMQVIYLWNSSLKRRKKEKKIWESQMQERISIILITDVGPSSV